MKHSTYRPEKFLFAPEVAGASPTREEISAATELQHGERLGAWEFGYRRVDVSDGSSRFPQTISGIRTGAGVLEIMHSGDKLLECTKGFLLVLPEGDVAGSELQMWPVIVGEVRRAPELANVQPRWFVTFSVHGTPSLECEVPPADGAGS